MTKLRLLAASVGAGLVFAAVPVSFNWTDIRPDGKVVGDLGYSLAAGVILGSAVWRYGLSPAPPDLHSTLLFNPPGCDGDGQCGMYGLASAAFVNTSAKVVMMPSSSDSPSTDGLTRGAR